MMNLPLTRRDIRADRQIENKRSTTERSNEEILRKLESSLPNFYARRTPLDLVRAHRARIYLRVLRVEPTENRARESTIVCEGFVLTSEEREEERETDESIVVDRPLEIDDDDDVELI